jgi:hypothetical protein
MTQVVTLRELSSRAGVDIEHLKRMIRIGSLPEASKQPNADGDVWAIPVDALPALADRHGWTIDTVDLTNDAQPMVWMAVHEDSASQKPLPQDPPLPDPHQSEPQPVAGQDIVVRPENMASPPDFTRSDEEVTVAEIIDGALLDRLLGSHEQRAEAEARSRESQRAMTAMAAGQQRMVRELAEERYERQRVNDRFRDERTARLMTDAKLAELRARLDHETAAAERERIGRLEANRRIVQAEREAAAALASMGWLARRKLIRRLQILE